MLLIVRQHRIDSFARKAVLRRQRMNRSAVQSNEATPAAAQHETVGGDDYAGNGAARWRLLRREDLELGIMVSRQPILRETQPDSALRVGNDGVGVRYLRPRYLLLDLVLFNSKQRIGKDMRPDIVIGILGHRDHGASRSAVFLFDGDEFAVRQNRKLIVDADPQTPLVILEQGRGRFAGQAWSSD